MCVLGTEGEGTEINKQKLVRPRPTLQPGLQPVSYPKPKTLFFELAVPKFTSASFLSTQ